MVCTCRVCVCVCVCVCVACVGVVFCIIMYVEVCGSTLYVHMCTKLWKMAVVLLCVRAYMGVRIVCMCMCVCIGQAHTTKKKGKY